MPDALTIVLAVGGFLVTTLSTAFGVWWKIQSGIDRSGRETREMIQALERDMDTRFDALSAHTRLTEAKLSELRTHVAETYISKQGLVDALSPVSAALASLNTSVQALSSRIDHLRDGRP